MRRRVLLTAVAAVAACGVAMAEGDLKSGPQVGDALGAYNVTKIAGPEDGVAVGATLCYR
jgi:hypothetical protein